mmetsp:Transcript_22505/g.52565  ORF Transcript_22505/g.52565 Transcript_22505/m.52565 type:complete len:272 (+) Transcript_22505:146-961(+)
MALPPRPKAASTEQSSQGHLSSQDCRLTLHSALPLARRLEVLAPRVLWMLRADPLESPCHALPRPRPLRAPVPSDRGVVVNHANVGIVLIVPLYRQAFLTLLVEGPIFCRLVAPALPLLLLSSPVSVVTNAVAVRVLPLIWIQGERVVVVVPTIVVPVKVRIVAYAILVSIQMLRWIMWESVMLIENTITVFISRLATVLRCRFRRRACGCSQHWRGGWSRHRRAGCGRHCGWHWLGRWRRLRHWLQCRGRRWPEGRQGHWLWCRRGHLNF